MRDKYWLQHAIRIDQYVNRMTGGIWPETLSCRCAKRMKRGCKICKWACRALDLVDPGHCERSYNYYTKDNNECHK